MNGLNHYTRTLCCSFGFLVSAFVAGCGGGGDQGRDPILGLPAAELVAVSVTPASASVASGITQQFSATASFADGSSRDVTAGSAWVSASPATATVGSSSGLARGLAPGSAVITASFGGKVGSAALTVTPATLVSVAVTPANPSLAAGVSQQFIATGTFTDASTRDITATSTFISSAPTVATIGAASGLATGVSPGTSVISATAGVRSGSTTLTVTPAVLVALAIAPANPAVPPGASAQLTVTATFSDLSTADVSSSAAFVSATPAAATVGASSGLVTGVAAGSSVMTAAFGGQSASTTVSVPPVTLSSIAVTPATATISVGASQQFVATGTFSDGSSGNISNSVSWTSGALSVGTVLSSGVATGLAVGTSTISATTGIRSGSAALNVVAAPPPAP